VSLFRQFPLPARTLAVLPMAAILGSLALAAAPDAPRTAAADRRQPRWTPEVTQAGDGSLEVPEPSEPDRRVLLARNLSEMLEAVQQHRVGPEIKSEDLVEGAIRGMLDTLDPHTHFLDRDSYRTMREGQDGSFFGLGIIISVRRDDEGRQRLTVISPIDGMPAKRLGIRPGDIIAKIDGQSTDDLTLDGAVGRLRGQKGTTVTITIERGSEKLDMTVERAEIPTESIQHAFMIRPGVGFIRIKDFTKSTTRELHDRVRELRAQGMERLILDLRDNPGGLLDQSISVASTFLGDDQLVVETRGRVPGSSEKHFTEASDLRVDRATPLIVLVNRGSASASEIVSGAIQDHDRGLIVGTTTWGKGLVQSVYSLSGDTGLALTTARYYTPSGRQIQRDWTSAYEYYSGPRKGQKHGEGHLTDAGREVYSGGGIEPDVEVEPDKLEPAVERMILDSSFFRFANQKHLVKHAGTVKPGWHADAATMAEFREFVKASDLDVTDEEWTAAAGQIRRQLEHEIVNAHLGLQEGFKAYCEDDAQVQAALGLWDRAEADAIARDARRTPAPALGPKAAEEIREVGR
jgi:carboxyl-terminal processing protease